jgi:hypothetical protein
MPTQIRLDLWRGNNQTLVFHVVDGDGDPFEQLEAGGYSIIWAAGTKPDPRTIKIQKSNADGGGIEADGADIEVTLNPDDTADLKTADVTYHEIRIEGSSGFDVWRGCVGACVLHPTASDERGGNGSAPLGAILEMTSEFTIQAPPLFR